MAKNIITNGELLIEINDMGAELIHLKDVKTNVEYMWRGDPAFWGRCSPVLFPIVGGLKEKAYEYEGKTYSMGQHGFARDCCFKLVKKTDSSAVFRLEATEETKKQYPFSFILDITYEIKGRSVIVSWRVKNEDTKTMYYSIGGHPGFMCPIGEGDNQTDYAIRFDRKDVIYSRKITENSLASETIQKYSLEDGILPVTEHLFDEDALVIEGDQAHEVSLLDPKRRPYVTVTFDAPLFGIWSPPKKQAPFICIEPWFGRCDKENFTGTLGDREWGQSLEPSEEQLFQYTITIE